MTQPPDPQPPRSVAAEIVGAGARGGALMLRDALLNGGVLLSLVVGIGGPLSGRQPWVWLGPVLGVIGVVVSFAGHRVRVVTEPDGTQTRREIWSNRTIWAAAVGVPVVCFAAMTAMWR